MHTNNLIKRSEIKKSLSTAKHHYAAMNF